MKRCSNGNGISSVSFYLRLHAMVFVSFVRLAAALPVVSREIKVETGRREAAHVETAWAWQGKAGYLVESERIYLRFMEGSTRRRRGKFCQVRARNVKSVQFLSVVTSFARMLLTKLEQSQGRRILNETSSLGIDVFQPGSEREGGREGEAWTPRDRGFRKVFVRAQLSILCDEE